MAVRADGDPAAAVIDAAPGLRVDEIMCDVHVVGGGTGGIACALAATRTLPASGRVALLEETDWIGGQLTAQGVSALDEHDHIERFGGTRSYYWNTGEAAGTLAAFALEVGCDPAAVHRDLTLRRALQRRLAEAGVPLYWFVDVSVDDPRFADLQVKAVAGEVNGAPDSLEYAAVGRRLT